MTTIDDQAFNSWIGANSLPGVMGTLPPAKLEQMRRSVVSPIFRVIPHIIAALEAKPAETDEEIISSFAILSPFEGLRP